MSNNLMIRSRAKIAVLHQLGTPRNFVKCNASTLRDAIKNGQSLRYMQRMENVQAILMVMIYNRRFSERELNAFID